MGKLIVILMVAGVAWWVYGYLTEGGDGGGKKDEVDEEGLTEKDRRRRAVKETVEAIVIAIVLAVFIRTFFVQAFKIPSGSMEDTLLIGDHLLVNKASYGFQMPSPAMINIFGLTVPFFETEMKPWWGEIKRGDVVVFRPPHERDKDFIKRIIGIPGDEVEVKNMRVFVNGDEVDEPYAVFKGSGGSVYHDGADYGPVIVPEGELFFMGDNRDRSYDSRFWPVATVDIKDVRGRAFIIYWSRDPERSWPRGIRGGRFFESIDQPGRSGD